MTQDFAHKNLKFIFFVPFLCFIVFYMIWRGSDYLLGPTIIIFSPQDGEKVMGETFLVKGQVKNAREIRLNSRKINIDQHGNFTEELIAHPPLTLVTITASDKYGKEKSTFLQIVKDQVDNSNQ